MGEQWIARLFQCISSLILKQEQPWFITWSTTWFSSNKMQLMAKVGMEHRKWARQNERKCRLQLAALCKSKKNSSTKCVHFNHKLLSRRALNQTPRSSWRCEFQCLWKSTAHINTQPHKGTYKKKFIILLCIGSAFTADLQYQQKVLDPQDILPYIIYSKWVMQNWVFW